MLLISASLTFYCRIPQLRTLQLQPLSEQSGDIWNSCNLLGDWSVVLHSCPSIQHKRPSCCSSACCLLMMSVYGWEESSIWSWPLEDKMSIKFPIFPEYQQIQFEEEGKSNRAIISTAVWCLWLMNSLLRNMLLWSHMRLREQVYIQISFPKFK